MVPGGTMPVRPRPRPPAGRRRSKKTYAGVTREDGARVAVTKLDGETLIATFASAGAIGWAYDAAREGRGSRPQNCLPPGLAPAPGCRAPAPAEDEEAVPPVTTAACSDGCCRACGARRRRRTGLGRSIPLPSLPH